MPGGYLTPVFQATGLDFDPVAPFIAALVIFDGPVARLPSGDAGIYSLVDQSLLEPICIRAPVAQQPICRWQAAHQSSGLGVIAYLTGGHEKSDWPLADIDRAIPMLRCGQSKRSFVQYTESSWVIRRCADEIGFHVKFQCLALQKYLSIHRANALKNVGMAKICAI